MPKYEDRQIITREEVEKMAEEACAFDEGNRCSVLTKKECGGCKFYKTSQQIRREIYKSMERFTGGRKK